LFFSAPQLKRDPLGLHAQVARGVLALPDCIMTPKALRDEILQLPPSERLKLLEEIWDSLATTPEDVPVPDWHKAELDRRLDNPAPGPGETWDQVRAKLRDKGS
jgi:putative addiction module component (TIGR02574 family)